jgi:hypothetical protein
LSKTDKDAVGFYSENDFAITSLGKKKPGIETLSACIWMRLATRGEHPSTRHLNPSEVLSRNRQGLCSTIMRRLVAYSMSDLTFKGAAATRGWALASERTWLRPASPRSRLKRNLSVSPPLHPVCPLVRLLKQPAPKWPWQSDGLPV